MLGVRGIVLAVLGMIGLPSEGAGKLVEAVWLVRGQLLGEKTSKDTEGQESLCQEVASGRKEGLITLGLEDC